MLPDADLRKWLLAHRSSLRHLFYPANVLDRVKGALHSLAGLQPRRARHKPAPVVVCPYLYDDEAAEVRSKFGLDEHSARHVEFYLWQDKERIGPELAFEHCWNEFPNRDVILVHSDMAPRAGDPAMEWYDALVGYGADLPAAGMIACNLYYPDLTANGTVRIQSGGGTFANGRIGYLHGNLDEPGGVSSELLKQVRCVEWVTFGGVLIRRETIRACGPFDRGYEWAYVMDVDYCFEARLRGFQLMQVPVPLQHEESRTTRSLWRKASLAQPHRKELWRRGSMISGNRFIPHLASRERARPRDLELLNYVDVNDGQKLVRNAAVEIVGPRRLATDYIRERISVVDLFLASEQGVTIPCEMHAAQPAPSRHCRSRSRSHRSTSADCAYRLRRGRHAAARYRQHGDQQQAMDLHRPVDPLVIGRRRGKAWEFRSLQSRSDSGTSLTQLPGPLRSGNWKLSA